MKLRWGRLVIGALVAEGLPILALVALVALFGPSDPTQARELAATLGRWVGPIGGAFATFGVAFWVAGNTPSLEVRHGLALGVLAAALDIAILVASGAPFEMLFVVSNVGRVIAGALGGILARNVAGRRRN